MKVPTAEVASRSPSGVDALKRDMRARMAVLRAEALSGAVEAALINNLVAFIRTFPRDRVVAAVWPLPREPDLRPLMACLHNEGYVLALPQTPPRGEPLVFRRWGPGAAMLPGRYGTAYPDMELIIPDVVLVPLLAFDAHGLRLGYGGGYYDRTLAHLPDAYAVGYGLAVQEVPAVPAGPYDQPLRGVVTENGLKKYGKEGA